MVTNILESKKKKGRYLLVQEITYAQLEKLIKPTAIKIEFKTANAINDIFSTTPKTNKYYIIGVYN
jgi:hypothetical protein